MMAGGGFMLIFGLLFMMLVIGVPILLIVAVVAGVWGLSGRRGGEVSTSNGYSGSVTPGISSTRYCSHCGQGLQADWTHCPRCGAPI
jgi:uncharacterized paraquat-inducible protein A